MSINVSQIFVRYPDEEDAAELLVDFQKLHPGAASFIVMRTPTPWLAVCASDNAPAPEAAQILSRALEATAIWHGLAGNTLAYRLTRYELGRDVERLLEPAELFLPDVPFPLPAYHDAEQELYERLRKAEIPREYVYLFAKEIGAAAEGKPDARLVREGRLEAFRHRVPRRPVDQARPLFDEYKEGDQTVYEKLVLHGAYDEKRGKHLFKTLEEISARRGLPPGWKLCYKAEAARDPDLVAELVDAHAHGSYSFDFQAA